MIKRNTWILIAVFVVLLGATLFLQKTSFFSPPATATATPNPPFLGDASDPITMIQLSDPQNLAITAKQDTNNIWTIAQPAGLTISQGNIQLILSDFSGMTVQSTLTSPLPLESTGLQLPAYTLTLTYKSGQVHVIRVGNLTATKSGYYVQLDSGNTEIVNQSNIDNVVELLKSVTYTPTPTITDTAQPGTPQPTSTGVVTPEPSMTPTP